AQEPAEAVAPAGSGDVRLLQLLNGFSGERARAAEVVVCEAQEVAYRRPETARRRSCLRIRVVEDDVLVRARLGLLVSARARRRLVEREQPVLGKRQRERRRERLRDRRDPKGGLG